VRRDAVSGRLQHGVMRATKTHASGDSCILLAHSRARLQRADAHLAVRLVARARGVPDLRSFESMGQRGFRLAADRRLANEYWLGPVLATAAEQFGAVGVALNLVSDRLLFPHVHTPERLMRQVRDLFPRDVGPDT
jgi:hypothetical protein